MSCGWETLLELVSPFRRPINQHFCHGGSLLPWSCTGLSWFHRYASRNGYWHRLGGNKSHETAIDTDLCSRLFPNLLQYSHLLCHFIQKSAAIAFVSPSLYLSHGMDLKLRCQIIVRCRVISMKSGSMGSLDHICGTTMPTVDLKQTITWKVGTAEWRELLERHIHICMRYWSFFRENKLQQKSPYNSWRQVGYVKLRGGMWFNRRRKSNHFKMN